MHLFYRMLLTILTLFLYIKTMPKLHSSKPCEKFKIKLKTHWNLQKGLKILSNLLNVISKHNEN